MRKQPSFSPALGLIVLLLGWPGAAAFGQGGQMDDSAGAAEGTEGSTTEPADDSGGSESAEAPPAEVFELEDVQIHGFGTWGYGRTDGNRYLIGSNEGAYDYTNMAVSISAKPHQQLLIHFQGDFEIDHTGQNVEVDYMFAEWEFTSSFRVRVGQVKLPFGLYTEVYNVGTLRPFLTLPQGIYGGSGVVSESLRGGAVTGMWQGSDWALEYDGYGGQLELDSFDESFALLGPAGDHGHGGGATPVGTDEDLGSSIKDLFGGRASLGRPFDDFKVGVSAYSGRVDGSPARHVAAGVHFELLPELWTIRSEYGYHAHGEAIRVDSVYAELARKVWAGLELATRYEWASTELPLVHGSDGSSLLRHRDFAVGVNYWFRTEFVVKFAVHDVDGNRFALPGSTPEMTGHGGMGVVLDERTRLVTFGASFTF